MKKLIILPLACMALVLCALFTMGFSGKGAPVAAVYLYQSKGIFQSDVDTQYNNLKTVSEMQGVPLNLTKKDVLESMIEQELLYQAAVAGGFELTQEELNTVINQTKKQLEAKAGRSIPDSELETILAQTYKSSMKDYRSNVSRQHAINRYIDSVQTQQFTDFKLAEPSEQDIADYYNRTIVEYVIPKRVEFSSLSLLNEKRSEQENYELAEKIAADIKSGALNFEEAVATYSDDEVSKSRAGYQGWLNYTDEQNRLLLSDDFFRGLFALRAGQVSEALKSNVGYHILLVKNTSDAKLLGVNDSISIANETIVVRDAIATALMKTAAEEAKAKMYRKHLDELRSRASISYPREIE